jgi:Flp pilus assembly protein TadB
MMGSLNALIGSLCLAGAVFTGIDQPFTNLGASILAGSIFVIAMLLHILYYRRALSKRGDTEVVREQAMKMGIILPNSTEKPR